MKSCSPRARSQDARTLYLAGSAGALRVTSTGESLVISRSNGDSQRVPISRVVRIVCSPNTEWSGTALADCQHRGIGITWLDHAGDLLGHLWPSSNPITTGAAVIELAAQEEPGWAERYDNWLRRQRLFSLQRWAAERGAQDHPVEDVEWHSAKRAFVYRRETPRMLPHSMRGLIASLVGQRCIDAGLKPVYWTESGQAVQVAHDLTELVWAELNLKSGTLAGSVETNRDTVAVFEGISTRCEEHFNDLLASLQAVAHRVLRS